MNELTSDVQGNDRETSPTFTAEQVRTLLDKTTPGTKVIAGARKGSFDITLEDLSNFYHLIDQRLSEQSAYKIERFESIVYLNNGTSRRLPSVSDIKAYAALNKAIPTVVSLHLSLLIQFPHAESVERQEIDVTIRASQIADETVEMQMSEDRMRMASDRVQIAIESGSSQLGLITYTINHTRISWGLDIENLLQAHIGKFIREPSKKDRTIRYLAGPLGWLTSIFVGLFLSNLIIDAFFRFLYETQNLNGTLTIVELASAFLINGHIAKYIVASLVVSILIIVVFSGMVNKVVSSIRQPRPSFILMTKADELRREEKLSKYHKRWTKFAALSVLNLGVALFIGLAEDRVKAFLLDLF